MFAYVFVFVITTAYKCPCLAVFTGQGCMAGTRKRETLLTLRRGAATPYQAERSSSSMDEKKQSKRIPNRPYLSVSASLHVFPLSKFPLHGFVICIVCRYTIRPTEVVLTRKTSSAYTIKVLRLMLCCTSA